MPLILGNECSGIVEKVGVNVKNFKIGDKVYARLAINKPGSFAEYVAINYKDVAKMPGDIDFKTAAAIPLTGLTAYQAFKDILKVKGGESVLVTGGSGSFGQMAVPIAKEFNLNVYLSGNAASKDNFLKLGVSQYFSYEKDDYSKSLKDQDYIIDTLGDKEIEKEAKCLKNGGKLLSLQGTPNKTFAEKII